jgi:hypothetical protein
MNVTKEEMKSKIMNIARDNKLPEVDAGAPGMDGISDIGLTGELGDEGIDGLAPCVEIVSAIIGSMVQAQIFHWQTIGSGSYAAHMALGDYYEGVPALVDKLVESYQGKHGIMKDYKNESYMNFESVDQLIGYFTRLDNTIQSNRTQLKESYIQSQLDLFNELINSTLYKLKNLQ